MRRIAILTIVLFAMLLIAACGAPSEEPVAQLMRSPTVPATVTPSPGQAGGNDLVATLSGVQIAVQSAATAQIVIVELTAQAQATAQAFAYQQTQSAATGAAAKTTLEAGQTATAAINTQEAIGVIKTLQAVLAASTVQAEEDKAEREALENELALANIRAQSEQRINGQQMINSLLNFAIAVLILVGLIAVLFFVGYWIDGYRKRTNILNVQNLVMQHNGKQWETVAPPSHQLPVVRPNSNYATLQQAPEVITDPDDMIMVNSNGETYFVPRITDDDQALRERVLKLLYAAMQINGGGSNVIPGWRTLRNSGYQPRTSDAWREAIAPLQAEGYVVSKPGQGSFLASEDCPDLTTLYREVKTWRIILRPANINTVEGEVIKKPNW